jgi:ATP-dependent RNA helicase SUPV3L1/SUV3
MMIDSKVKAVLGPTNTGKTHLAVERLCAHSSGMIGFPLRLLAREIYDRVVAVKGAKHVALVTGEERIVPADAQWWLCTTESIPMEKDVAFVAIDEIQLGADPERGHIFTDRLLNARGREETMLLGSESVKPLIKSLLPAAEIITRPRFSKLTFTPPKKLSRLPPRSAIVAFSVEEVYAIAEMLRQSRGGAAVVMGALSPRTRNAQVKMYQDGDVDYLVATDAIGMGLNMDVGSVYFASLSKFDGRRQRRLSIAEMAQIAGRAGRHQRDGHFGSLAGGDAFADDEIDQIEEHRFPKIDHLFWRSSEPDFTSLNALIASLEVSPEHPKLRAAPEAEDLIILKLLAEDANVRATARTPALVATLWDICRLPDFQKLGPQFHAHLISRMFTYLSSRERYFPEHMFADQIARLESIQGDVPAVAQRIAVARTWAYIAQRANWLGDPDKWRLRTAALEEKLSDALHAKLTERFVDKRGKMLMKHAGAPRSSLAIAIEEDGTVLAENQAIGSLTGFRFTTDPLASLVDRRRLITAAEKHLARELASRATKLASATDREIVLAAQQGMPVTLQWNGLDIAQLARGKSLLSPKIMLDSAILKLPLLHVTLIKDRLTSWLMTRIRSQLSSLFAIEAIMVADQASPALRALIAELVHHGGIIERETVNDVVQTLSGEERRLLKRAGLIIGSLDIVHPALIRPEAARWRVALTFVQSGDSMPPLPMAGLGLLDRPTPELERAALVAGYRKFGTQMLRIDLLERIARKVHEQRSGRQPFIPDRQLATTLGIGEATLTHILRALGFAPVTSDMPIQWRWRGVRRRPKEATNAGNTAFSALGEWNKGNAQ